MVNSYLGAPEITQRNSIK